MKSLILGVMLAMPLITWAGGMPGETRTCTNEDDYTFKESREATGLGAINPFDFHKNIFVLKKGFLNRLLKEEYSYQSQYEGNEAFVRSYNSSSLLVAAAQEWCGADYEIGYIRFSTSMAMTSCDTKDPVTGYQKTYYLVEWDNQILVFDQDNCNWK